MTFLCRATGRVWRRVGIHKLDGDSHTAALTTTTYLVSDCINACFYNTYKFKCIVYPSVCTLSFSHLLIKTKIWMKPLPLYISHAPPQSHGERGLDTGQVCQHYHTTTQTLACVECAPHAFHYSYLMPGYCFTTPTFRWY